MLNRTSLICKEVYNYYNYHDCYEFTITPLNYYNRQRIKFRLRRNIGLDKLDNCKIIKTSNMHITWYATSLYLCNCNIITLPSKASIDCKLLKILDISENKLTILPSRIGKCKSIKCLYLNHNRLIKLPTSIGNLTLITDLNIAFNRLTELPCSIGNLRSLVYLQLQYNQLTKLPPSIGNLTLITDLDIAFNRLTELPPSISNLKSLKRLHLIGNQFTDEYVSQIRKLLPNCRVI